MDLDTLLSDFKSGRVSAADVKKRILQDTYADLGMARLDTHRPLRSGLPEAVYCESKTPDQVTAIFGKFAELGQDVLGTRARQEHADAVLAQFADAEYDAVSRLLKLRVTPPQAMGKVVAVCAGTSDLPTFEEAAQTCEFLGSSVTRHVDCGCAGLHRLIACVGDFSDANCIIAVAGMDGVLPTIVSGLSACPVIALPTSVGYGVGQGGVSALMTMLNSCAPGLSAVNVDNGFGAGYLAHVINRQSCRAQGAGET